MIKNNGEISVNDMVEAYIEKTLSKEARELGVEISDFNTKPYYTRLSKHMSNNELSPEIKQMFGNELILDLGEVLMDEGFLEDMVSKSLIKECEESNTSDVDFLMHLAPKSILTNICQGESVYTPESIPLTKGMKIRKALKKARVYNEKVERILDKIQNQFLGRKGRLKLSIDPRDLMTVSWNTHGWRSCFRPQGEYRFAPFELMQEQVAVAYIETDRRLNFKKGDWNSKKWRALVFISEGMVCVGKQYPSEDPQTMLSLGKFLSKFYPEVVQDKELDENGDFISIEHMEDTFYNDFYENGLFGHDIYYKSLEGVGGAMEVDLWQLSDIEPGALGAYGLSNSDKVGECEYCEEALGKVGADGSCYCADCQESLQTCHLCGKHFHASLYQIHRMSGDREIKYENILCPECKNKVAPCVFCGETHDLYQVHNCGWMCYNCIKESEGFMISPFKREVLPKTLSSLYSALGRPFVNSITNMINPHITSWYYDVNIVSDIELKGIDGFIVDDVVYDESNLSCFGIIKTMIEKRLESYKEEHELKGTFVARGMLPKSE